MNSIFKHNADHAQNDNTDAASFLHAVMNTVLDGLIIIDEKGTVLSVNPSVERIFGYQSHELIGQNIRMLMPEPYHSSHDGYMSNYLNTGDKKVIGIGRDVSGKRKDGRIFDMELGINEMQVDGARMFVGTVRDITKQKHAEHESALLAAIVASSDDAIISKTLDGIVVTWNAGATRLFGYTAQEAIGRHINLIIPAERYGEEQEIIGQVRAGTPVDHMETVRIARDGRRIDISLTVSPVRNKEGDIVGASKVIRDISATKAEEKALRASQARLRFALETTNTGAWELNLATGMALRTPIHGRIFGYSDVSSEWTYDTFIAHVVPDERNYVNCEFKRAFDAKSSWDFECRILTAAGDMRWIWVKGRHHFDVSGTVPMASGIVQDITVRKETEFRLQKVLEALQQSNQELDDFAHIAAHDLTEPLRGLSNNASFLMEDYEGTIDAEGLARLGRMTYLCQRMERLVDDLMYFSRLGRQELAIRTTDLNDVIADIKSTMEDTLIEENATISIVDGLPTLICDRARTTEVFRNLITNAIKYNKNSDKRVDIGCNLKGDHRVFYVRDNGIGIPERFHNDVFQIFKRLNDEDDAIKGTGVGLTFVKKIVERHNGQIWIESEVGVGSTFYFTISEAVKE
jgi:PAS domain S-box-containing protein